MAIDFVCGWECRIAVTGAAPAPDERHWNTANNTPLISTTTVRTGTASLRINAVAQTQYLARTIARTVVSGRVYLRIAEDTGTEVGIITFINANGNSSVRLTAARELRVQAGAGSAVTMGSALSLDTWYRVDFLCDTSTGTASMKARIDGGTEYESTVTQTSANNTSVRFGANGAQTMEMFFDDLILGTAAGDYPFGAGTVERMKPNADGTHSFTAGDFGYDAAGGDVSTSATDVNTYVDDDDLTAISEFIRQKVIRTTGYLEVAFAAAPHAWDALAVAAVGAFHSAGTGANQMGLRIRDGSSEWVVTDDAGDDLTDISNTTHTNAYGVRTTAPSGGAWTQTILDAILARCGYSGDVSAIPYWDGVMLEVAYGDEPAAPGPGSGWWAGAGW